MGFVLDLFGIAAIVAVVLWVSIISRSVARDREAAAEEQRKEEARLQDEVLQERLLRAGEPLRCMGCDLRFCGPLPDTGCPRCHVSTLVVPDDSRPQQTANVQTIEKQDG